MMEIYSKYFLRKPAQFYYLPELDLGGNTSHKLACVAIICMISVFKFLRELKLVGHNPSLHKKKHVTWCTEGADPCQRGNCHSSLQPSS